MSSISSVKSISALSETAQDGNSEVQTRIPRLNERLTEELVIALVGPVGSGCTTTYYTLKTKSWPMGICMRFHYYKLSEYIAQGAKLVDEVIPEQLPAADRIDKLQTVGDKLRKVCHSSYLAAKAVEKIAERRDLEGFGKTADGVAVPKKLRQVHIIDSIKHPEELKLLRDSTYGKYLAGWRFCTAGRPRAATHITAELGQSFSEQNHSARLSRRRRPRTKSPRRVLPGRLLRSK